MSDKLKVRVQQILNLKSKGSSCEVQAMFQIIELERMSVLWKEDRDTPFETVLANEKLCTPSRYRSFRKATTHFKRDTIDRLGVSCVCLLAIQNAAVRERILAHALKFRDANGTEPTYQYVARFLRGKSNGGPTRKQLLKYIEDLKEKIRELNGRVPGMTTNASH